MVNTFVWGWNGNDFIISKSGWFSKSDFQFEIGLFVVTHDCKLVRGLLKDKRTF